MRPDLTRELSMQAFKDFYWLKEELQAFCRKNGISASGSKLEISHRVEEFLRTGKIKKTLRTAHQNSKVGTKEALSLDTVTQENHRCSQHVRAFFKNHYSKLSFLYIYSELL